MLTPRTILLTMMTLFRHNDLNFRLQHLSYSTARSEMLQFHMELIHPLKDLLSTDFHITRFNDKTAITAVTVTLPVVPRQFNQSVLQYGYCTVPSEAHTLIYWF